MRPLFFGYLQLKSIYLVFFLGKIMNQKFKDCLLEVYHAEQAGEIIFESLVKNAKNRYELFIFGSMLQLETEAKAIMRPTLIKLDLSIEELSLIHI